MRGTAKRRVRTEVAALQRPGPRSRAWPGFAAAIAGLTVVGALLLTPIGSQIGLVGDARASSDVDPCGFGADPDFGSTTPVNPALGFNVGSGPAALQCGFADIGFPPLIPEKVPVEAPDGGASPNVDGTFRTGFPYMIGPDGAEVTFNSLTANQVFADAAESAGISLTIDAISALLFPPADLVAALVEAVEAAIKAVIDDLIKEDEAMQGADWDWFVPSHSASGDWYRWFTWSGFGDITPSSISPSLINWYSYAMDDPSYQNQPQAPYARVYLGASRVSMKQGPGIVPTAETLASEDTCLPVPGCFGRVTTRSARPRPAPSGAARGTVGRAIHADSSTKDPIGGTTGNDEFRAEKGDLKILAGAGHDQVLAGRGANRLRGGGGHDELTAFAGEDRLRGNTGHDVLQGGPGPDVSIGNRGSDSLFDAQGSDRMFAGGGDDRIVVRDRTGDDVVDCGPGTDMVIADPGDRIVGAAGASSSAARHTKVPVGAFTREHTPKGSTCERVYSSVHMPPRKPPSIGHPAGRPPGVAEPAWPVFD